MRIGFGMAIGGAVLAWAAAALAMPAPAASFGGTEAYEAQGKAFVRYKVPVGNGSAYAADQFAAAPDLPPCGSNAKASRTWVDVKDARNPARKLNGFCSFKSPAQLRNVWFALPKGTTPPSEVVVVLTDRRTGEAAVSRRVKIPGGSVSTRID